LLERTTRKMQLSAAGKPVYELCRTMLDSAREAASIANLTRSELQGVIRIAAPKAIAKHILEPLLLSFALKHPQISLHIKVTDHIVDPIYNEVDLLVSLTERPNLGLIAKELAKVSIILCASAQYIQQKGQIKSPQELSQHSCITLGESADSNTLNLFNGRQKVTVEVTGRYWVNHSEMRLNAIKQGLGVGLLPDFIALDEINKGNLIRVLPNWCIKHNYQGTLRLQYAQSKYIPERLKLLVNHLVDNYPELGN
jgi:DNA-binding transcriptional LysR family regulator